MGRQLKLLINYLAPQQGCFLFVYFGHLGFINLDKANIINKRGFPR